LLARDEDMPPLPGSWGGKGEPQVRGDDRIAVDVFYEVRLSLRAKLTDCGLTAAASSPALDRIAMQMTRVLMYMRAAIRDGRKPWEGRLRELEQAHAVLGKVIKLLKADRESAESEDVK
jgi:hypothetical protein